MATSTRELISGTKFRWDRNLIHYRVVTVLKENPESRPWPNRDIDEILEHDNKKKDGWSSHVFELSAPVCVTSEVKAVIDIGNYRIYPPFALNRRESHSKILHEVEIPKGAKTVSEAISIPSHATTGLVSETHIHDAIPCYGLRIDAEDGLELDDVIEFFLRITRQYSKQWCLSSAQNPFDTGLRLSFEIEKDFAPHDVMKSSGAGEIKSSWHGASSSQGLIGFELPVNPDIWSNISICMQLGYGLEDALQYHMQAVGAFMSYDDKQCIMNLSLMFEVAENKTRILSNFKTLSKNKNILKHPIIANNKDIELFRKLITDRDNIAHGRRPHHYTNRPKLMVDYLEASTEFISRYLNSCHEYGWDKTLKTSL